MKRTIILLFILLTTYCGFSQSSNGYIITYDLNYVPYIDQPNRTDIMTFKLYVDDNHSIYTEERLIKRNLMDDPESKNLPEHQRSDQRYYDFYDSHIVEKDKDHYFMVKDNPGVAFIGYQAPRMTAKDWQMTADTTT